MPTAVFRPNAAWRKGKLRVGFAITAVGRRGMSVFKAGRRVPVTYEIQGEKGKVLAKGTARYG